MTDRSPARSRTVAHGYDTGAWPSLETAPSWIEGVRSDRVAVRPGVIVPSVVIGAAASWCVAMAGLGAVNLDPLWAVPAGVAAVGALALAVRGFPLPGVFAALAAMACWAFATRSLVPESLGDVGGMADLVAGNLALAVPLVCGFAAGIWVDGRRRTRTAVTAALAGQRWFGVNRGESEPQLPALERLPSVRFFALPEGRCAHLVVAGRRAALVGTTVWPPGEYAVEPATITRNGRPFSPGTDDVDRVVDDVRYWRSRLAPARAECQAFLVIHPASARPSDRVRIWTRPVGGVRVVAAPTFAEAAGTFLAPEANRLNVEVMEALAELYAPPVGVDGNL